MAHDTSGSGTATGGTTLVIPGEAAARIDRLPMSAMAWEICLIVQIGWAVAVSTDAIAARMYPFIWLPAKEITHSQYNVLFALEVGIGILIGGYVFGWLSDKIGRLPTLIVLLGAGRGVHLAVRVRDQLPRAGPAVHRQHAGYRRVPGHQRGVHERDHGPDGAAAGHDGLPGGLHLPARRSSWSASSRTTGSPASTGSTVAARRPEHPGRPVPARPDARVATLAGGPGTPGRGARGGREDGGAGQQERPPSPARARPGARTRW